MQKDRTHNGGRTLNDGTPQSGEGLLSPYRVLDLTDERGFLCGKMLGDLGADVIKIERPGGDPARNIGPFYHDDSDPQNSLYWFAFNANKRGITLDIGKEDGRELFKQLVKTADFVTESFSPGYMDELSLGYPDLEKVNPGIIMVSITPFGQSGPYRDFKAPDIVVWAMGGEMYVIGESDRAPVHVSYHSQAYLQAAGAGASAAMLALYHRNVTGEGQHIDVSAQEVVARIIEYHCVFWDMMKVMLARRMAGDNQVRRTQTWPCKDGYVSWQFWGGQTGARWTRALVRWMDSEGMADDYLKTFDWESLDFTKVAQEVVDRYEAPARKFFMAHTRDELLAGALKHDVMLFPVDTVADTLQSSQLAARRFWTEVEHPELGTKITYPGPFAHSNGLPPRINRRAPLIGEHNREVYEQELGISPRELSTLKLAGVV